MLTEQKGHDTAVQNPFCLRCWQAKDPVLWDSLLQHEFWYGKELSMPCCSMKALKRLGLC